MADSSEENITQEEAIKYLKDEFNATYQHYPEGGFLDIFGPERENNPEKHVHDGNIEELARHLKALPDLKFLSITEMHDTDREEKLTDIGPLAELTSLKCLDLHDCKSLENIEAVAELRDLEDVELHGTKVSTVEPFAGLEKLKALSVRSTEVDDLRPILGMKSLKKMNCAQTPIADKIIGAELREFKADAEGVTYASLKDAHDYYEHLENTPASEVADSAITPPANKKDGPTQ